VGYDNWSLLEYSVVSVVVQELLPWKGPYSQVSSKSFIL
jgi:hypothetical protein